MKKSVFVLFINLSLSLFVLSPLAAEKISFSAEEMSGQAGSNASTTVLNGNAFIKTEDLEVMADRIELTGENYRYIKAKGNISGKSTESKMEFTCDSLEFDRETNIALLKGDVSLIDAANEVSANAQMIEYNQSTEVAVLQVKVKLTQKNNVCSGAYAVYQKKNQLLEISGNAQVRQGSDTFRAQQISLNMETQDIKLTGNVKGSVTETANAPKTTPVIAGEESKSTEVKSDGK